MAAVIASINCAPRTAAQSFMRGTYMHLIGAIRDFAVNILRCAVTSLFSCRVQTTAGYVKVDASQKTGN